MVLGQRIKDSVTKMRVKKAGGFTKLREAHSPGSEWNYR